MDILAFVDPTPPIATDQYLNIWIGILHQSMVLGSKAYPLLSGICLLRALAMVI